MEDYNKQTEELLSKMKKQEEIKNKKIIVNNWVLAITALIFYFGIVLLADFTLKEGILLGIIITVATILLVIVCFFVYKTEIDAGYYECKNCHHKFTPTYKEAMFAMHIVTKRHLKCPECNKRTWTKKVMSR